jgi:predicted DNA-binding transcriptional regulator YafY
MNKTGISIWKNVCLIGAQQGAIKVSDLSEQIGLSQIETMTLLRQLFPEGTGAEIYQKDGEQWVDFSAQSMEYMLPLTPGEWLKLRELVLMSSLAGEDDKVFNSLKKKLLDDGPIQTIMNILGHLEKWEHFLNEDQQKFLNQIEVAIDQKSVIELKSSDEKIYNLFPWRIVFLEGHLSLIAEDTYDHCLVVFSFQNMKGISSSDTSFNPRASLFEIDEFISAIRSMGDKETRLILKIHTPQNINLFPQYHFLGKPCMITNSNGDVIWAAYVEPCEDLYDWLLSLGAEIDILDPTSFKTDFLSYCEAKLRKIA